jgi:hypothetical protein
MKRPATPAYSQQNLTIHDQFKNGGRNLYYQIISANDTVPAFLCDDEDSRHAFTRQGTNHLSELSTDLAKDY